jgi:hypothetical protein
LPRGPLRGAALQPAKTAIRFWSADLPLRPLAQLDRELDRYRRVGQAPARVRTGAARNTPAHGGEPRAAPVAPFLELDGPALADACGNRLASC